MTVSTVLVGLGRMCPYTGKIQSLHVVNLSINSEVCCVQGSVNRILTFYMYECEEPNYHHFSSPFMARIASILPEYERGNACSTLCSTIVDRPIHLTVNVTVNAVVVIGHRAVLELLNHGRHGY